jgi:isopenicillin-N N-acyltransferase-like protein
MIVHGSGEMYNIEVSARQFGMLYGEDGYLVHTNFYLDPTMRLMEDEPDQLISARVRYYRALRLLKQTNKHTALTLQEIQKDHVNYPDSICNHGIDSNPLTSEKTIFAMVIDLTNCQMNASWGSPCKSPYNSYVLKTD